MFSFFRRGNKESEKAKNVDSPKDSRTKNKDKGKTKGLTTTKNLPEQNTLDKNVPDKNKTTPEAQNSSREQEKLSGAEKNCPATDKEERQSKLSDGQSGTLAVAIETGTCANFIPVEERANQVKNPILGAIEFEAKAPYESVAEKINQAPSSPLPTSRNLGNPRMEQSETSSKICAGTLEASSGSISRFGAATLERNSHNESLAKKTTFKPFFSFSRNDSSNFSSFCGTSRFQNKSSKVFPGTETKDKTELSKKTLPETDKSLSKTGLSSSNLPGTSGTADITDSIRPIEPEQKGSDEKNGSKSDTVFCSGDSVPSPCCGTDASALQSLTSCLSNSFVSLENEGVDRAATRAESEVFYDILHRAVSTETLSEYFAECQKMTDDEASLEENRATDDDSCQLNDVPLAGKDVSPALNDVPLGLSDVSPVPRDVPPVLNEVPQDVDDVPLALNQSDVPKASNDVPLGLNVVAQAPNDVVPVLNDVPPYQNEVQTALNGVPPGPNDVPLGLNDIPQAQNDVPLGLNDVPPSLNEVSLALNDVLQTPNEVPPTLNDVPQALNEVPQTLNDVPLAENEVGAVPNDISLALNDVPTDLNDVPLGLSDIPQSQNEVQAALNDVPPALSDVSPEGGTDSSNANDVLCESNGGCVGSHVNFSIAVDVRSAELEKEATAVITNQGEKQNERLSESQPDAEPYQHGPFRGKKGVTTAPAKQKLTVTFADTPQLISDDGYDADTFSEGYALMAHSSEDNALLLRIRQLEDQLILKTQRLEEMEGITMDDSERTARLEALERLESELKEREQFDAERDEELRLLQEALEEALEEKAELESRLERDGSRETQLLEDFEWKLHEIERDYKKKIADAETAAAERVKEEMAAEFQRLQQERLRIDEQLHQVEVLKSHEIEAVQLRGLVHEQQRALRVASRQIEQLRNSEKLLQDDVNKLRSQGYTRKQQQELEQRYEEKLAIEKEKLRTEITAQHEAEKMSALVEVTKQKDEEINLLKSQMQEQQKQLNHQITELRQNFERREADLVRQVEATRATADRDLMELRRHINKLHDSHAETLEQLQKKHAEELEQCIASNQLQEEFDAKIKELETKQQNQLAALQNMFEEEKQEALLQLGEHYQSQLQALQEHAALLKEKVADSDHRNQEEVRRLADVLAQRESELQDLRFELSQNQQNWPGKNISKSSSQDAANTSSPPIGRSAGDGCSPTPSPPTSGQRNAYQSSVCSPDLYRAEPGCCNDPEHYDAQQFVLELQQVLADRDAELQRLTEEKRFYQMELIHWERSLVQARAGVPLSLVPDRDSMDQLNWRGYSAPPVTKPRLPDFADYGSRTAEDGNSLYGSSGLASPCPQEEEVEEVVEDEEERLMQQSPYQRTVQGCWLPRMDDLRNSKHPEGSDEEDDDDPSGSGFTTPLPYRDQQQPFFV